MLAVLGLLLTPVVEQFGQKKFMKWEMYKQLVLDRVLCLITPNEIFSLFPYFCSSILPTYWTKWVDRPGIEAKWSIYFQNPKGTKFTSKAQINKYIEKYHLSYSSDIFDFELDVNVNKLQKIWKRFFFKKSSSDSSSGDDSSNNADVDIMTTVDSE